MYHVRTARSASCFLRFVISTFVRLKNKFGTAYSTTYDIDTRFLDVVVRGNAQARNSRSITIP